MPKQVNEEFIHDDSSLLPNEGGIFHPEEPEDIKEEEDVEKSMVLSSAPIIPDLLAWFENEVKETDSITAAQQFAQQFKLPEQDVINAFKIVKTIMEIKKENIKTLFEIHIKNR